MINEAVRIADSAVNDGTIGLAVQLAAITKESGDTVSAGTIYNEMQHGDASRDNLPEITCLIIASDRFTQSYPRQRPRQTVAVPLVFRGIERDEDTPKLLRRASYRLDALDKVFAVLITSDSAIRTRNGWSLANITDISGGITSAALTDVPATWEWRCTFHMNPPV